MSITNAVIENVIVTGDSDSSVKAMDKARTSSDKLKTAFLGMKGSFTEINQGFELIGKGLGKFKALADGITNVMRKQGQWWSQIQKGGTFALAATQNLVEATGGLIDTTQLLASRNLLVMGDLKASEEQVEAMTKAAVDFSRSTGEDVTFILQKLTQGVLKGSAQMLARFGVHVEANGTLAERSAQMLAKLADRYRDVAIEAGDADESMTEFSTRTKMQTMIAAKSLEDLSIKYTKWKGQMVEGVMQMFGQGQVDQYEAETKRLTALAEKMALDTTTTTAQIAQGDRTLSILQARAGKTGEDWARMDAFHKKSLADEAALGSKRVRELEEQIRVYSVLSKRMGITQEEADKFFLNSQKAKKELSLTSQTLAIINKQLDSHKAKIDAAAVAAKNMGSAMLNYAKNMGRAMMFWAGQDDGQKKKTTSKAWTDPVKSQREELKVMEATLKMAQAKGVELDHSVTLRAQELRSIINMGYHARKNHEIEGKAQKSISEARALDLKNHEEATKKKAEITKKAMEKRLTKYKTTIKKIGDVEGDSVQKYKKWAAEKNLTDKAREKNKWETIKKNLQTTEAAIREVEGKMIALQQEGGKENLEKFKAANDRRKSLYQQRLSMDQAYTKHLKDEHKKRLYFENAFSKAYKDAAQQGVKAVGEALWQGWDKSNSALKEEGRTREQLVKKILKDEAKSMAKQAFLKALWEGALALGSLAIHDYSAAAKHGAAAAAYGSLAVVAGGVSAAITDVGGKGSSSSSASQGKASAPVVGGTSQGSQRVTIINFPQGTMIGDPVTFARVIRRAENYAAAAGKL